MRWLHRKMRPVSARQSAEKWSHCERRGRSGPQAGRGRAAVALHGVRAVVRAPQILTPETITKTPTFSDEITKTPTLQEITNEEERREVTTPTHTYFVEN